MVHRRHGLPGQQDRDQARRACVHQLREDHLRLARSRVRPQPHHLSRERFSERQRQQGADPAQTACPERHANEHSGGRKRQGHRCVQLDRRVCGLLLQRRRPRQCDGRRAEHHDAYDRGDRRVQRRQLSELHPLDRQAGRRPLSRGAEQRPGHPGVYQDPEPDPRVEQRVLVGELAGVGQHAGHVSEPGLYRHVPPGRQRAAALGRQPEAVPVHLQPAGRFAAAGRRQRRGRCQPDHRLHRRGRDQLLDQGVELLDQSRDRVRRQGLAQRRARR